MELKPKDVKQKDEIPTKGDKEYYKEIQMIVDRINQDYAVVLADGNVLILREHIKDQEPRVDFMTIAGFKNWWQNLWFTYVDDGKEKSRTWGEIWLASPKRREYIDLVFKPHKPEESSTEPGAYNLWRGWPIRPDPRYSCSKFLEMVENVICGGNSVQYEYLLNWMAYAVQYPQKVPEVAVAMISPARGIGKSFFAKYFLALFGIHGRNVKDPKQFSGRFNAHLKDCIALFVDEAVDAKDMKKNDGGVIKGLITEPKIRIEPKGIDSFEVDSCLHILIASNKRWVVEAARDERRYFCPDLSTHRKQDHEYFRAISREMDEGGLAGLLYLLANRDLSEFEVRVVPRTKTLAQQKGENLEYHERFVKNRLEEGYFIKGAPWGLFPAKNLLQSYKTFSGGKGRLEAQEFGSELKRMIPGIRKSSRRAGSLIKKGLPTPGGKEHPEDRVQVYEFPPLEEARRQFAEYLDSEIEWPEDELIEETV